MIHKLNFSIDIKSEEDTIWNTLWNEHSYRDWAGVFFDGSFAVTDNWIEGSTVQFLGPDLTGIYSRIEKHIPNKIMQFKHIGTVVDGQERPIDEETKSWSGATETYQLTQQDDVHTLSVEIDVMDEHLEFMTNTFPKALEKIKKMCS